MVSNQKFVNALKSVAQPTPPIWFMRQAGRYHSHYQEMKKKYTFETLCKKPELAAEVALGPIRDFDFDVSILFSDLLFPLECLGMGLKYDPGPQLSWRLDPQNISKFIPWQEAVLGMQFQAEAVRATRELLPKDKSLIGFVGGPWTLFTYAVEGSHKGNLTEAKKHLFLFPKFCEIMVPFLQKNIELQLQAGAEMVLVIDTAAGELGPDLFASLLCPETIKLFQGHSGKTGYYMQKLNSSYLNLLEKQSELAGFGVDHRQNMASLLKDKNSRQLSGFRQGNFDQALLFLPHDDFKKILDDYLAPILQLSPEQRAGWVCGVGHGILPETPERNVKYFIQRVREKFHG